MTIRTASDGALDDLLSVVRRAFGSEIEAELVRDLLADPSAAPRLSLLAEEDGRPVGHVLFTAAQVIAEARAAPSVRAAILAPLAVVPEAQGRGWGRRLVDDGLRRLAGTGVGSVFVLGDPRYYARFGFAPARTLGLAPPCPIPAAHADAWMVRSPDGTGPVAGRVQCADTLNRPELWQG